MRFENNHPTWHGVTGVLMATSTVAVSTDVISKSLLVFKDLEHPMDGSGTIRGASDRMDLSHIAIAPILLGFRGADAEICPHSILTMKRTGASIPIDESICHEFAATIGAMSLAYWIDPEKSHNVRRIARSHRNKLVHQMDITYMRDEKWGWLAQSWVYNDFDAEGGFVRKTTVRVAKYTIGEPIHENEFELSFPPNARVYDATKNKYFRIQNDGAMLEVNTSGEPIGNAAFPQTGSGFAQRNKFLIIGTVICIGILSLFLFRRWQRKK